MRPKGPHHSVGGGGEKTKAAKKKSSEQAEERKGYTLTKVYISRRLFSHIPAKLNIFFNFLGDDQVRT